MIHVNDSTEISYGLLDSSDVEEMTNLLAEVFSRFEPMAVAAGMLYAEINRLVGLYCRQTLEDELTIVAREKRSNKLIGVMIAIDFAYPQPPGILEVAPNFEPVGALLNELEEKYRKENSLFPGKVMNLFMLAIVEDFAGKSVAQNLTMLTLKNGLKKGYERAVTEATSKASQHVFRKLGFVDLFQSRYSDFIYHDRHIFETITGSDAAILMQRNLHHPCV